MCLHITALKLKRARNILFFIHNQTSFTRSSGNYWNTPATSGLEWLHGLMIYAFCTEKKIALLGRRLFKIRRISTWTNTVWSFWQTFEKKRTQDKGWYETAKVRKEKFSDKTMRIRRLHREPSTSRFYELVCCSVETKAITPSRS